MKNIIATLLLLTVILTSMLNTMERSACLQEQYVDIHPLSSKNIHDYLDIEALSCQYFNMIHSETEEEYSSSESGTQQFEAEYSSTETEDDITQLFEVDDSSDVEIESEIATMHPLAQGLVTQRSTAKAMRKKFPCTFEGCNKSFAHKNYLSVHMRIHTKKSFMCEICNKSFVQKGGLTRHMRLHTGEKPFACEFCDKSFTRNDTLKKHMRIHKRTEKL